MARRLVGALLIVLMAGSVLPWIGVPVGWLYVASHVSESSQPSMGPYAMVVVGVPATMIVVGKLLAAIDRTYARVTAADQLTERSAMATADLTVIALGRADASASRYIAEIQRRLAAQDRVRYVMHAMGTSLEGSTADILAVAGELHAVPFELGIPRVYSILKLDERRDREQTLEDKVASVQALLDEPAG